MVLPPDCLPVIKVILSYLKINSLRSRIFRTSRRSQDTFNKFSVIYQCAFELILYYISLSQTYFLPIHAQNRLGHVLALATQNGLFGPRIHRRSQWKGPGNPGLPIKIPQTTKSYDNVAWRCLFAVFFSNYAHNSN